MTTITRQLSRLLLTTFVLGSLLLTQFPSVAFAQDVQNPTIEVISSSSTDVVLRITVPDYAIEEVQHGDDLYHIVNIPHTVLSELAGAPQIASLGTMVGVSGGADATLSVLDAEFDTLSGYHLLPAPKQVVTGMGLIVDETVVAEEVFDKDETIYTTDAFYPTSVAELGETAYLRDQAVAPVTLHLVQTNPVSGELRIYRQIDVRITWGHDGDVQTASAPIASPVYEAILKNSLINYSSLDRPAAPAFSNKESGVTQTVEASASSPVLKIGVEKDGMYRITYNDLQAAGLNPDNIDPRKLWLRNRGEVIPMFIPGADDGVFDTGDTIIFYGASNKDVYTTKNIYWLKEETTNGTRMAVQNGAPDGSLPVATEYPQLRHFEEDDIYWQTMPNGEGQDHFFWHDRISPDTSSLPVQRTYTVTLGYPATTSVKATVRVHLKGFTNLKHRTQVFVNDVAIDEQTWSGQINFEHEAQIDQGLLNSGNNTVKVMALDSGASVDQVLVNWIEINYRNLYHAVEDRLYFGPPAGGAFRYSVDGFTQGELSLFNVSNQTQTKRVTNTAVDNSGGVYTLRFSFNAAASDRFIALGNDQFLSAASIEADVPSTWKSNTNGADYIIITHPDFYTETLTLANFRSSQGMRVKVVLIGDIYDEFNYGIYQPTAIRDFLSYAYSEWVAPAPTYVALVGDAYHDHRGVLGTGAVNYVPAATVETNLFGQVPSDNWFVSVSGDDPLRDMHVGRLAAQTSDQAAAMIANIIANETTPPDNSWNQNALLIADDDDPNFMKLSDQLESEIPYYYNVQRIDVINYPPGDPTADITAAINAGSLLTSYTGHGEVRRWGVWEGGDIYNLDDVSGLSNSGKMTLVTTANCLSGYFTGSYDFLSMSEALQRTADQGAIGVWSPSSLEYPAGHRALMSRLYDQFFQNNVTIVGAAITASMAETYAQTTIWGELLETYIYFGDPATVLGIANIFPTLRRPNQLTKQRMCRSIRN